MTNPAKLELTIKIHQLPTEVVTRKSNGWKEFVVDCDGRTVTIALRPRAWNKLEEAQAQFPMWVAAITGQLGPQQGKSFALLEPAVQVFEKKAREPHPSTSEGEPTPTAENSEG